MSGIVLVIAIIMMLVGLVGIVAPGLPGIALVFLGAVVYAIATGFQVIGWGSLILFLLFAIIGYGANYAAAFLGAEKFGASKYALLGAAVGGIAGFFIAGLPGIIIGEIAGVLITEYQQQKKLDPALKASFGALLGFFLGTGVQLLMSGLIIGIFLFQVIFNK